MGAHDTEIAGAVVPTLRYRDLAAAIDWLCNAFGFERHLVVDGDNGSVCYAQLRFGDGMVMLAPIEESAFDRFMTQPAETGGAETQICYLYVEDATSHYARAKAAGAEIVLDIGEGQDNGRGYSCRDPEGHIWNFGTYDPWRRRSDGVETYAPPRRSAVTAAIRFMLATCLLITAITSTLALSWIYGAAEGFFGESETGISAGADPIARERSARENAERALQAVREQLGKERSDRLAAERAAKEARSALAQERGTEIGDDRPVREASNQLTRLSEAERAAHEALEQLTSERLARESAERASRDSREQLAKERAAREAAERAAGKSRERLERIYKRIELSRPSIVDPKTSLWSP